MSITLRSSDGVSFVVDEAVARYIIGDDLASNEIPVLNVRSQILAKVIKYSEKHVDFAEPEDGATDEELKALDAEFVRLDLATLCDLLTAAKDFKIKGLMDLTAQAIADLINGKTIQQIRETFMIAPKARNYAGIMSWMLVLSLMLVAIYSTRKQQ